MTEKELSEAKKNLADSIFKTYIYVFFISIIIFIILGIFLFVRWESQSTHNIISFSIIALFFLVFSITNIVFINIGLKNVKNNKYKIISGKVIDFKYWGMSDGANGYNPIVKTENNKTIRVRGADRDEDGIEIGQSYTFLQLFGVAVPVKNEKEKASS